MTSASIRDRLLGAYGRQGWRGFDRLLKLSGHKTGDRLRARSRYGSWLELDPWSYIDRIVLREGYYESEVLLALIEGLKGGGVLWDVGANIGLHSVTAKVLAPKAKVVCFEPSPSAIGRLWTHIAMNGVDCEVVTSALSDEAGFVALNIASEGNNGMSSLSRIEGRDYVGVARVWAVSGDELIAAGQVPAPTVVKIDVEGHELAVLRGMKAALASPTCRRVVFEDPPEDTPVKALLRDAGFELSTLARGEHSATDVENFVAVKP